MRDWEKKWHRLAFQAASLLFIGWTLMLTENNAFTLIGFGLACFGGIVMIGLDKTWRDHQKTHSTGGKDGT